MGERSFSMRVTSVMDTDGALMVAGVVQGRLPRQGELLELSTSGTLRLARVRDVTTLGEALADAAAVGASVVVFGDAGTLCTRCAIVVEGLSPGEITAGDILCPASSEAYRAGLLPQAEVVGHEAAPIGANCNPEHVAEVRRLAGTAQSTLDSMGWTRDSLQQRFTELYVPMKETLETNPGFFTESMVVMGLLHREKKLWQSLRERIGGNLQLGGADLSTLFLLDGRFDNALMTHANLTDTHLVCCYFCNATIREANFSRSVIIDGDFTGANLEGVSFRNARLIAPDFRSACLRGADFRGASLESPWVSETTELSGANFLGASASWLVAQRCEKSAQRSGNPSSRERLNARLSPLQKRQLGFSGLYDLCTGLGTVAGVLLLLFSLTALSPHSGGQPVDWLLLIGVVAVGLAGGLLGFAVGSLIAWLIKRSILRQQEREQQASNP